MDTSRYQAFLSAAETGSIKNAAEELGYTPSGVSQLINWDLHCFIEAKKESA